MNKKFQKIAKRIVEKDKDMFDALLEFEKTKRIRTKTRVNFTIEIGVVRKFRKFCREHGYNMSAKIEDAMEEIIK